METGCEYSHPRSPPHLEKQIHADIFADLEKRHGYFQPHGRPNRTVGDSHAKNGVLLLVSVVAGIFLGGMGTVPTAERSANYGDELKAELGALAWSLSTYADKDWKASDRKVVVRSGGRVGTPKWAGAEGAEDRPLLCLTERGTSASVAPKLIGMGIEGLCLKGGRRGPRAGRSGEQK
jgi:hypothetical protein